MAFHQGFLFGARVLAHALPARAVVSLLAPSWSYPVANSCHDAHDTPPAVEASLPRRLPGLSTCLHCLVGCGTCTNGSRVPEVRSKAAEETLSG